MRLTKSKSKFIKVDVKVEEVDAIDKLELVETLIREIKIHIRKWIQCVKHSLSLNIFKQNMAIMGLFMFTLSKNEGRYNFFTTPIN